MHVFILQALDCCPFSQSQAWTVGFGSKELGCSHFTSKCGISELHSLYVNAVGKKIHTLSKRDFIVDYYSNQLIRPQNKTEN